MDSFSTAFPAWFAADDYWLSRWLFERALAAIYLVAFLVAAHQFPPLLGERGLLPVPRFLAVAPFRRAPSLFHLHYSDRFLLAISWTGVALSALLILGLPQAGPTWLPMLVWLILWLLYMSIVNVGQTFYGFGWESLLLEAGFLAVFLGTASHAPPRPILWLIRWLLFRVEFGAGLIKMRGDSCWRDLTCLYYHHETQPMPNPLSWYFHHLPKPLHKMEVFGNHVLQLAVPFLLFAPQPVAGVAGVAVVVHQTWLVFSGNFAWLNVLTLTLGIAAFDDRTLGLILRFGHAPLTSPPAWYVGAALACTLLVLVLSYWPVRNLLSRRQAMNASFNPLHLVNTYGAFGSISRQRFEIVLEGTDATAVTSDTAWREYEFKGKPGDPRRRPPQFAPYHLRLDWLMWFVPLSPSYAGGWLVPLVQKLLQNDRPILRLLRHNPFADHPPTYLRATYYHYRFTTWSERRQTGAWWVRERIGDFLPPMALSHATSSAAA